MATVAQTLADAAVRMKAEIRVLLEQHSRLNPPSDSDSIVLIGPKRFWDTLPREAQYLQSKILRDYKKHYERVRVLVRELPDECRRSLEDANDLILGHVEQQYATWGETEHEASDQTVDAFDRIQDLVDRVYSVDSVSVVVPDTNALLASPDLSRWRFDGYDSFTVILTPTVLSELDKLKTHRDEGVRAKAGSVIRRIKELARRGDLNEGVTVLKGRITARGVAVEPKMAESLSWLDANNNDDRFLASVIEIMRAHIRSSVTIVTRDVNLQNKADFAGIPWCEPPAI